MEVLDPDSMYQISERYAQFLESFSPAKPRLTYESGDTSISSAMYYNICQMKYAGWKHRVNFKRSVKHSLAEIFQDTIAFFLNRYLPGDYSVHLEVKRNRLRPDILIKKNDINHFIIEVKTSIGWNRGQVENYYTPGNNMRERISKLSTTFNIPEDNVIYIFEDYSNVSKAFSKKDWDKENLCPTPRPTDKPFSFIYPLFHASDPYYWDWKDHQPLDRDKEFPDITKEEIALRSQTNIVTPFELILDLVQGK